MSIAVPAEFAELQPFVAKWARPTEDERAAERRCATAAQLQTFYDTMVPHLPKLLERIDRHSLGKVEGEDRVLYHLLLSVSEIAPHVELYKLNPLVPFAFTEVRMIAKHGATAD